MPEFQESIELCNVANPLWLETLKSYFGPLAIDVISMEDNMRFQSNKWGDFLVILDFPDRPSRYQTVETKVQVFKYYSRYVRNGKCILFETMGNTGLNRRGSAFVDSKADLYATAYLSQTGDYLTGLNVFLVAETARWLKWHLGSYNKIKANTGGVYETEFILVPLNDIPYECRSKSFV